MRLGLTSRLWRKREAVGWHTMRRKEPVRTTWKDWALVILIAIPMISIVVLQDHHIWNLSPGRLKNRFYDEFPGLDKATALTTEQKEQVVGKANQERCPCGCHLTLAACLSTDFTCPRRQKNLERIKKFIVEAREAVQAPKS